MKDLSTNFYSFETFNLKHYIFPNIEDSHMKEILEITQESLKLHEQICKYSFNENCEVLKTLLHRNQFILKSEINQLSNYFDIFDGNGIIFPTKLPKSFYFKNQFDIERTFGYSIGFLKIEIPMTSDCFLLSYDHLNVFSKFIHEIKFENVKVTESISSKTSYATIENFILIIYIHRYRDIFGKRKIIGNLQSLWKSVLKFLVKNRSKNSNENLKFETSKTKIPVPLF